MASKMKFLDLVKQYESIKREVDSAIKKTLSNGGFIAGKETEGLEKEIAKFCAVKYAVSLNSGTDALFLSLRALGIGPKDEVITSPFTFIATAESIANNGARPVFVDIDPATFNIDCSKIEKTITKKTKAIIPVHLFGKMAEMDKIMAIAKKYNLYVIEDTAQAMGAKINLKSQMSDVKSFMAGAIGDLGCFSFFPSKNLGAYGDGGMVITNNRSLAEKIRLLKNHGSSRQNKYLNLILGTNSRLDTIQAAILRVKLKHLNNWNKKRIKAAAYYSKKLRGIKQTLTPFGSPTGTHVFNSYTIRIKKGLRDKLAKYLNKAGVPTMIYYLLPLHLQPAFRCLGYKKGDFPEAEKAAKEVLSLPIYPELKKKEQDFIVKTIKNFYEQ